MPSSSSLPASSKSSIGVIPSEDIKVDTSACLGSGAAGVVYKARYGNQLVVVKRLNLNRESPETERAFKKEAETLAILNHPRIVRFLGIVMENDRFSIVLEFMPLGSLYQHYTNPKNTPASLSDRLSLTLDIATGMQYLHACQPPVLHRDMKSLNVLLLRDPTSGKLHAKITDFGLALVRMHTTSTLLSNPSVKTGGSVEMTRSGMGTLMWMAPELHVLQATYKKHCDVFSFGVVMTELVSWIGPYGISIMDDRYDAVIHMLSVEKRLPDLSFLSSPSKSSSIVVPNPLLQIIIACLDINPKKRPDFTTIVAVVTKVIDGDQDASPATSPLPTNQQLGYPPVSQTQYQPQPSFVAQPQHQPLHSPANQPQYQAPPPPVTRDFDPTRQYLAAPPPAASFQQIASPHSPHSPHSPAHQLHSPHSPHSSPHQLQAPTPYHYASSNSPAYPDPQFSNPQDHTAPSKSFPTPTRKKLILIILVIVGIVILLAIGVSVGAVLGRNSAQNSPPSSPPQSTILSSSSPIPSPTLLAIPTTNKRFKLRSKSSNLCLKRFVLTRCEDIDQNDMFYTYDATPIDVSGAVLLRHALTQSCIGYKLPASPSEGATLESTNCDSPFALTLKGRLIRDFNIESRTSQVCVGVAGGRLMVMGCGSVEALWTQ